MTATNLHPQADEARPPRPVRTATMLVKIGAVITAAVGAVVLGTAMDATVGVIFGAIYIAAGVGMYVAASRTRAGGRTARAIVGAISALGIVAGVVQLMQGMIPFGALVNAVVLWDLFGARESRAWFARS